MNNKEINIFFIEKNKTIRSAMKQMTANGRKCLVVVDNNSFYGTLSDGDIRKSLLNGNSLDTLISNCANTSSYVLNSGVSTQEEKIKKIFYDKKFDFIPIVNHKDMSITDILFWDDFLQEDEKLKQLDIPVYIMAGGAGSRLKPFTDVLPKPLVPIGDKTVIERIIDQFTKHKSDNFYISINYKSKILKAFFEELNPEYKLNFIMEEKPLGTGGSLSLAKDSIKTDFILTNCDVIFDIDFFDLVEFHKDSKNSITIVASTKEITLPYGNLILDQDGNLESTEEKPSFDFLVNTGMYVINPSVLELIQKNKKIDFTDVIDTAISKKFKVGVYPINEDSWIDTGQWSEYKRAINKLG